MYIIETGALRTLSFLEKSSLLHNCLASLYLQSTAILIAFFRVSNAYVLLLTPIIIIGTIIYSPK